VLAQVLIGQDLDVFPADGHRPLADFALLVWGLHGLFAHGLGASFWVGEWSVWQGRLIAALKFGEDFFLLCFG
jgi:hypothetical protein